MVKDNTSTITMRLVRSKLRKREDPRTTSIDDREHHGSTDDHQFPDDFEDNGSIKNCKTLIKDSQHVTFLRTSGATSEVGHADAIEIPDWTFPPKAPTPHIYHINPEMLMPNEKNSFKGFRKQFSGRFKRLVARKLEPTPVIPPELKPQLKTIYVY